MLPAFLLRMVGGSKPLAWLAIVLASFLVAGIGYAVIREIGVRSERDRQAAAVAAANLKAAKVGAAAREAAATERAADATATATTEREYVEASKSLPDARPSDRRRAGLCYRVHDAGRDRAAMAECARLGYPGRADAKR